MQKFPTTSIILDTRRRKRNGTYPVKLRVTFLRRQKYYSAGLSLRRSEFEKAILMPKPRGIHKDHFFTLSSIERKAKEIIDSLPAFSYELFERHFLTRGSEIDSVYSSYENYIEQLRKTGHVGTASTYECSCNSFRRITGRTHLTFSDVTVDFLKNYEQKMRENGNSVTTISMYVRCLRTLFNEAIDLGIIKREFYPFGRRKYLVPASQNIKKALPKSDIEKIFKYPAVPGSKEQWARDLWLFSYLCNGINIRDIVRLRFKDVREDKIVFIRSKTEHTSRGNLKPIVAILHPVALEIIERWGNSDKSPENYVFGIMEKDLSPAKELQRVKQTTKTVNKYLKRIAVSAGIMKHVTTYAARHSFSTVMKQSGASMEFISESLGHSDLRTTEAYLGSFDDSTMKEYASHLTNF